MTVITDLDFHEYKTMKRYVIMCASIHGPTYIHTYSYIFFRPFDGIHVGLLYGLVTDEPYGSSITGYSKETGFYRTNPVKAAHNLLG